MTPREKVLLKWIDRLGIPEECQEEFMQMTQLFDDDKLMKPFILEDIRNGVGRGIILARYGITIGKYRWLRESYAEN